MTRSYTRNLPRLTAGSLVAIGGCIVLIGCASTTQSPSTRPASEASGSPPRTIRAAPLTGARTRRPARRGSTVRSQQLHWRVFVSGRRGFALVALRSGVYPAATADGGRRWFVDGPVLYTESADAPLTVTMVGALGPRSYYAYGGGSVVDFTSDGGRRWYRATLGDYVLSVVPSTDRHHMIAVVQNSAGSTSRAAITAIYVSSDGGRFWHLTQHFAY